MLLTHETTTPLAATREAVPNEHAQRSVTEKDTIQAGSGPAPAERHGREHQISETRSSTGSDHRSFAYPVWPTSIPGSQATLPPSGQHPHPERSEQLMYACYDQERGRPCVPVPAPVVVQQTRAGSQVPGSSLLCGEGSEAEALARWIDDGRTEMHGMLSAGNNAGDDESKQSTHPATSVLV